MNPASVKSILRYSVLAVIALGLASCAGDPSKGVQPGDLLGTWQGQSNDGQLRLHFSADSIGHQYELTAPQGLDTGNGPLNNILSSGI